MLIHGLAAAVLERQLDRAGMSPFRDIEGGSPSYDREQRRGEAAARVCLESTYVLVPENEIPELHWVP